MRKIFNKINFDESKLPVATKRLVDGHRFYKINDIEYPSVTTVISATQKSEGLKKWRDKLGHEVADAELVRASTRGTKMHTLIEEYITGRDASIKDILPRGLFDRIRPELDKIDNIRLIEKTLYDPEILKMAGTVDCIAEYEGILSVIDFKSSNKYKRFEWCTNYFIQACAYSIMFNKINEEQQIEQIAILIAGEDGTLCAYIKKIDPELIQEVQDISDQFYSDIMPNVDLTG